LTGANIFRQEWKLLLEELVVSGEKPLVNSIRYN